MFGADSEADALWFPPSRIGIKTPECYVRSSNTSYSYNYYLIEVYATGIFYLSFLVLQYVQNMYFKFKLVNYLAKPILLSSKPANLPSRMSALSRDQNDKYDVQRLGVT